MSTLELSDAELLEAWAAGCRSSGNQLIERHFAVVYRFFRNKVGNELEDLVQQTFLACVEARARYEERSRFVTFLIGIARNQLFSHYSRSRRQANNVELSSIRDLATSPTGVIAKREDEQLLLQALRCVPLKAQIILELVYWEDLKASEVAEALDLPLNTVYSQLRRAREALREQLELLAPDRVGAQAAMQVLVVTAQHVGLSAEGDLECEPDRTS